VAQAPGPLAQGQRGHRVGSERSGEPYRSQATYPAQTRSLDFDKLNPGISIRLTATQSALAGHLTENQKGAFKMGW